MIVLIEMLKEAALQGLIFGLVVMGVYLTSRVIRCDDLSVEGSFGFGGALAAFTLLEGMHPMWTLPISVLAGGCVGTVTGILHTKFKLHHLIAGIVVTTAFYSINLKMAGANVSLMGIETVFDWMPIKGEWGSFLALGAIVLAIFGAVNYFLKTEVGFVIRASGCNPALLASLGKNVQKYKILGFCLAGACSGLAGGLFVQLTTFYSLTGSMGMMMMGLTGLIIAEMFTASFSLALVIGAMICQAFFALTIALGVDPSWNYLIKGVLIVAFLQLSQSPLLASERRFA
ncbi:ABC-type transporter, permease subunit [Candidatus Protochlamydia naegleriophila]|uniref:ABC-type transporter, permease subunit n=1 Tax=Candidatus Protochlamydia naegleriophila TaxID=389348 RepID=A0A0U5JBF4_9BACT|nr:ABC transporter permease [Candidatus Protochlamydia naegleriophila]CUI16750.1 ABC-type transporter, permease subunit [Candidatus Protochlamydia naegleriophila]